MLRIQNRQNLLPELYHMEFSVQKIPYDTVTLHPDSMSQHILHQNSIPSRRILNKNVRDCSDEFSVLDDGAAAHALDDPAGQGQKFRIGYANDHVLVVAVGGVVYFLNLNLVVFQFPGHAAADAGTAFFDVLTVTDRNCRVLYPA